MLAHWEFGRITLESTNYNTHIYLDGSVADCISGDGELRKRSLYCCNSRP